MVLPEPTGPEGEKMRSPQTTLSWNKREFWFCPLEPEFRNVDAEPKSCTARRCLIISKKTKCKCKPEEGAASRLQAD